MLMGCHLSRKPRMRVTTSAAAISFFFFWGGGGGIFPTRVPREVPREGVTNDLFFLVIYDVGLRFFFSESRRSRL